jgi:hypothetical protein
MTGLSHSKNYVGSRDVPIAAVATEQDRLIWVRWDQVAARFPGDPAGQLTALPARIARPRSG